MSDKKTYSIKAKVVVSTKEESDEKSDTTNEFVFEDVLVTDVTIKPAGKTAKEVCDLVCEGTKKCYEAAKGKLKTFSDNTKEKIDEVKRTSEDYQEFASAQTAGEKTKVVISHIKRDSASAGKTIKEKYISLRQSVIQMRSRFKNQNDSELVSDEHFVSEEEISLIKNM